MFIQARPHAVHALRDVINFDTLHHRKYIAVNGEASRAFYYVEKMATKNGGLLVFVFCTFYNYFPNGSNWY